MANLVGVQLGLVVGAIPTISMSLSSLALSKFTVSKQIEATLQNFCAGLILTAVGLELFPLLFENTTDSESYIGITVGFVIGLCVLYGMESLISYLVHEEVSETSEHGLEAHEYSAMKSSSHDATFTQILSKLPRQSNDPADEQVIFSELYQRGTITDWDDEGVHHASLAMAQPEHRNHLNEHIEEIVTMIEVMEQQCSQLLSDSIDLKESELLAEKIDESTHALQYKVDHCRRLIQGSEVEISGVVKQSWVTEERKRAMQRRLQLLKLTGEHLIEHLREEPITTNSLKEMHQHMTDMDQIINTFHDSVENVASRWTRRNRELPEPELGATIPAGLVIPVALDCFVDGFLIGVSCGISPQAGIVLGAANTLEMASLGMAYSVRLNKCTGSSWMARQIALYSPPLLMLLSAGLGAFLSEQARDIPAVFVAFVAFGVVALLSLVCTELLIEAKECIGDEEGWYFNLALFAAVYLVLMLSTVI